MWFRYFPAGLRSASYIAALVEMTAAHRFAAEERGFVSASQLRPEDRLATHDERGAGLVSTEARSGDVAVYNLSVDRFYAFFVSSAGLWVHNFKDAKPPEPENKG